MNDEGVDLSFRARVKASGVAALHRERGTINDALRHSCFVLLSSFCFVIRHSPNDRHNPPSPQAAPRSPTPRDRRNRPEKRGKSWIFRAIALLRGARSSYLGEGDR